MWEKISPHFYFIVPMVLCVLLTLCTGLFCKHAIVKPGDSGNIERDYEYSRQMGRAAEFIGAIDIRLTDLQAGLDRIKGIVSADARDLRIIAERLRDIASEVAQMEEHLHCLRSGINGFLDNDSTGFSIEMNE